MFRDVSFWLYMLRDTSFAIDQEVVDRMSDYMLDGTRWTIRGDIAELYLGYRPYKYDVGYTDYADEYIAPLERMMIVDTARSSEYLVLLENIMGERTDNGLDGNNYMWRVGYASHMREDYGVNIKMDSKRIIGGEWRGSWPTGQDQGQLIYWTSSATSTIMVDGDEYTNVFPTYDWAHCPGATTANRIVKDYANYGRFTNGTDHTIGVTNGTYGNTAYVMNKKDTQATKGYFFFDDEFVALGAGINSKEATAIHTTLNQSEAENVRINNQIVPEGTKAQTYSTNWIYNDKVGYVFPTQKEVTISNTTQTEMPSLWADEQKEATPATFTAWLDHGQSPKDASYEYIVVPNVTAEGVDEYAKDIPIVIVENSKEVQAVRHDELKITQINFYTARTLEYAPGKTITVDQPCSIIIDETGESPVISLAMSDTDYSKTVNVTLTFDGEEITTAFTTNQAPYTGKTMTLSAGQSNLYDASSFVNGHLPKDAYDGNLETYWKSDSEEEQWISSSFGENTFVSKMKIDWKDNYATKYKVQISTDGHNYIDVAEIENGNGGQDEVSIYDVASHVKIVCLESNNQQGYEIKEVTYYTGENISTDKQASASSVSTQAPTYVPKLAVDGITDTRWASLRNSDAEWLMVDLGGTATIDALTISWESARSSKYTIEISDDKEEWKSLKVVVETVTLFDKVVFEEPATGRYLRINSEKSLLPQYGISIFELVVYGNVELGPIDDLENIAIGKSASASSINSIDAAEKAIDGNVTSYWKSGLQKNHWLNVALRDLYTVSRVSVKWGSEYLNNYRIEYSTDGNTWQTAATMSQGGGGNEEVIFEEPVDAKYIRLIGDSDTDTNIVVYELEIYGELNEEAEDTNLALNKPSEASSEYINPTSGFVLESKLAFDGSTVSQGNAYQSRWVSKRESNDEWILVDLLDTYLINSVVLNWEGACGKEYKILVSKDKETWEEAAHITNGVQGIKEIIFDTPIEGRYVKMQGILPATKYGYSLWEFEVYGKKEIFKNVALNKDSVASSEYKNPTSGFVLESKLAFDGSIENQGNAYQSRWVSKRESNNEWIYVNLDGVYDIRSIVLNWEGAYGKEYKIQVSNDLYTWSDIAHITNGAEGIKEISLEKPVYAQYVKMQGILPATKYGYSLWEFEVYGKKIDDFYVDKIGLEETIIKYTGIVDDGYTPDSYQAYKDALVAANIALTNDAAVQTDVNTCIDNLKAAVEGLEKHDTEELEAVIALAKSKVEEYYTEESYKAMESVLQQAIQLLENGANNNAEYVAMTDVLDDAITALVKKEELPEVTAQDIADRITSLHIVDDMLELPEYVGFTITLYSSSDESIIALDRHVYRKNDTRHVGVVLQVVKEDVKRDTADTALTDTIDVEVTRIQTDINYDGLKAVMALVTDKNEADYTNASYQAMLSMYQQAESLIETGAADSHEVEDLRDALSTAIQNLVSLVELKDVLANVEAIDGNKYTNASMTELTSAMANAQTIVSKADASKEEVTEVVNELKAALSGLNEKADTSKLEELINVIEALDTSKYTEESIQALEVVLEKAKAVLQNTEDTQEQIDAMYDELMSIYNGIKEKEIPEKADTSKLEELINMIEALDTSKYTEESIQALEVVLEKAKAVLQNTEDTQEQIDAMYDELMSIYNGIKEKEIPEEIVINTDVSSSSQPLSSTTNEVKTADIVPISHILFYMLLSLFGGIVINKKKEEQA